MSRDAISSTGEELARIDDLFGADEVPQITAEEFITLHEALGALPDRALENDASLARRKFLYFAANMFDRWAVPGPIVVEPEGDGHFVDIVATYRRLAPADVNLAFLTLHELLTELWTRFAVRSLESDASHVLDDAAVAFVSEVSARANAIPTPLQPRMRDAIEQYRARVVDLGRALVEGTVTSVLTTVLPHAAVRAPIAGSGTWRGMVFTYSLQPEARTAAGMTAVGNAVVSTEGRTRAESGTCEVTVTFPRLIDYNAWTPHLIAAGVVPGPVHTGQPFSQTLLYHLLHDLLSRLQDSDLRSVDQWWVITPRDVTQMSIHVNAGGNTIVGIPMLNLGSWRVEVGPPADQHVDVPDLEPSPYWTMCRRQARGYLSLGATREALLWLNMAVEALLDERIDTLTKGRPELREKVTTSKLLFADAEEALVAKYPDLAGKVEWPDREQAPSRFAQIKTLCHDVPLAVGAARATSMYSRISGKRNDVIHGRDTGLIATDAIQKGLDALDWLDDALRATETQ